ncbi:uracil phosphoribosyltransferase [Colletotrichum sojae]|uniref:Uracil phosphoribosyltransferase n=1 Tax=Colletotrichum sojae TaxID=2175907 RepID=A0A8H6IZP6_9PEZI|nr:uracil phosphoribosyltransferase [Colletotrichum sojae]
MVSTAKVSSVFLSVWQRHRSPTYGIIDEETPSPDILTAEISVRVKPKIVGLYGVPASGKSFLLQQLRSELRGENFRFFEGAEVIASIVPGGLEFFKRLCPANKELYRERAINFIADQCASTGQLGIVSGHFSFWSEKDLHPDDVYTPADLNVHTHVMYLDARATDVVKRCLDDPDRVRPTVSVGHVHAWQDYEKANLRRLCRENGILFTVVPLAWKLTDIVLPLMHDIRLHSEAMNLARVTQHLDQTLAMMSGNTRQETLLVFDADRTLCDMDSGKRFWGMVQSGRYTDIEGDMECPLKTLFSSSIGYSYTSFRQAAFLYEEARLDFESLCSAVASEFTVHPEFVALLRALEDNKHVGALSVTCGLRRVWEKIIEREGLSDSVGILGGGRIADGYVVTPEVKAAVVSRARDHHGLHVCAFGDSPMDLPMLKLANDAVVVVGMKGLRSNSMDAALLTAIDTDGLRAREALITSTASPRLTVDKPPLVDITHQEFIQSIFSRHRRLRVLHATNKNAAKLLMTPTRDAAVAGPDLRRAHHRVGFYLATEYVSEVLGLETHDIRHVQGHMVDGHQLMNESKTAIVALMRGGEPMAFGISEAFPKAMFIHSKLPEDLDVDEKLKGIRTVLLVDSVINSGKSVKEYVDYVRGLDADIRIVVVAGVVQKKAITRAGLLGQLASVGDLSLVALRLSDNKFTGKGGTDTGHRLFNTTHLD